MGYKLKHRYFPKPLSNVSILWTSFIWNFIDTVKKGYSCYTSYLSVTRIKVQIIVSSVRFTILFFPSLIDFHEMVNIEKFQFFFYIMNSSWIIHPESASKVYTHISIDSVSLQTQSIISLWPRMDWFFLCDQRLNFLQLMNMCIKWSWWPEQVREIWLLLVYCHRNLMPGCYPLKKAVTVT